mmetsp:Transcript_35723/g.77079  ORF Transcript_35723/g.77079 Transcript_35723/m.77079 type:complete len:163 (-) Transcript_35723:86-574(-)
MLRLTSAVENFNPHEHAWKVSALREWYSLLFLPGVHEHHDIEEKIFFPFYATLGATLPPRLASDHTVLMKMLADVQLKLVSMQEQVDESVPITSEQVDAFKSQVTVMCATMLEHLHEEEIELSADDATTAHHRQSNNYYLLPPPTTTTYTNTNTYNTTTTNY